ncbi:hypothetical protein FRC03_009004 [Tulasnella sp. 419]|nr:hypothetical protein FRC03_009004 [Tulasnella sp. 419]
MSILCSHLTLTCCVNADVAAPQQIPTVWVCTPSRTANLDSMEILKRPPPPPGPSKTLSSPLSCKLAAIHEAKQKHKDREAGVPVAQPQHSPDDAGVTERNAAAGTGEETLRKRRRRLGFANRRLSTYCGKQCNSSAALSNHLRACRAAIVAQESSSSSSSRTKLAEIIARKRKSLKEVLASRKKESSTQALDETQQAAQALHHRPTSSSKKGTRSEAVSVRDGHTDSQQSSSTIQADFSDSPPLSGPSLEDEPMSPPCSGAPPSPTPQIVVEPISSGRTRRLPKKFNDFLPTGVSRIVRQIRDHVEEDPPPQPPIPSSSSIQALPRRVRLTLPSWMTPLNEFGVFRRYRDKPSLVPDEDASLENFLLPSAQSTVAELQGNKTEAQIAAELDDAVAPFPNLTSFWFRKHHSDNPQTSKKAMDKLQRILLNPRFQNTDLRPYNREKVDTLILDSVDDVLPRSKGWIKRSVDISVPLGKDGDTATKTFTVEGLYYRRLVDVVTASLKDDSILRRFHLQPFEQFWQPHGSESQIYERVYDEFYNTDAMIEENNKLQRSPREPGCDRERVLVALLLASDATQLASFGQAKAWPVYGFYGNHSKYERCRPTANLAKHIAFLPSLPDEIQDFIRNTLGKAAGKPIITQCRRELMHAIWRVLFDDEFIAAWKHGIVIKCFDDVERRFYIRVFTYSADYPEKVLLATIRDMGKCPCPRCLIEKKDIGQLGTEIDMRNRITKARIDDAPRQHRVQMAMQRIYSDRRGVNSTAVEGILQPRSEVPVVNAFSEKLSPLGFNFHRMLVNDFLHEFELGEWKALFTHLIRILYAENPDLVHELDARFRQIPPYGRDTIRRFHHNVSEMKKLAARDFEDILQCSIPVLEDLLPSPHNQNIRRLLFAASNLHALCKLRMHTESTLIELEAAIKNYGRLIRHFSRHTCAAFATYETPKEVQARARRAGRKEAKSTKQGTSSGRNITITRPQKQFNLERYKLHALGDYPATIRLFGTTESYSTQRSELQHTKVKGWFARTSKNHTAAKQMTAMDVIERRLQIIEKRVKQILSFEMQAPKAAISSRQPQERFEMAKDPRQRITLGHLLKDHEGDPAVQYFWQHLMDHLLTRLQGGNEGDEEDPTNGVIIKDNMLFQHSHARFNYTTYDVRRAQDTISMRTERRYVMLAANDASKSHPFWYARVLGIFHTFATDSKSASANWKESMKRVDFLWVRWLTIDTSWKAGLQHERLDRVSFMSDGPEAFGFVDPCDVVRACHLIPAFSKGRTKDLLDSSFIRDTDGDFRFFFVNRFVDRDMYMRYRGNGIGHLERATRASGLEILTGTDVQDNEADAPTSVEEVIEDDDNDNDNEDNEDADVAQDGEGEQDEGSSGSGSDTSESDDEERSLRGDDEDGEDSGVEYDV